MHVFLRNLPWSILQAFNDLLQYGFGASSFGQSFSTIYGGLVIVIGLVAIL